MIMKTKNDFEIIVVGGGHAGIEAALAAARMGCHVAMVTMTRKAIGRMSCNPAVGGLAKGQLVVEIDALGGEIGYATDLAGIQFRLLNRSKGPAVQSRRAQCDRALYSEVMIKTVENQERLEVIEGEAVNLNIINKKCAGIILSNGETINIGDILSGDANTAALAGGSMARPLAYLLGSGFPNLAVEGIDLSVTATNVKSVATIDQIWSTKSEVHPGDRLDAIVVLRTGSGESVVEKVGHGGGQAMSWDVFGRKDSSDRGEEVLGIGSPPFWLCV